MWRLEKDPYLTSTFATVSVLDRPPDFDRLRARMERAVGAVPRLRWRVQPAPVNLSAPTWVDDPDFDIDLHVRRIAVPRPGSLRQLLDLATLHHPRPVRAHPAAVAVHRHRGTARRQGRPRAEDAPHDHRRRGRGADVLAVPRLRTRRPRPRTGRRRGRRRRRTTTVADDGGNRSRPAGRRVPAARRHRPPGEGTARRPHLDPDRGRGHPRHDPRRRDPAVRRRAGPLAAVAGAFAAPAVRGRRAPRSPRPRRPPSDSAAR